MRKFKSRTIAKLFEAAMRGLGIKRSKPKSVPKHPRTMRGRPISRSAYAKAMKISLPKMKRKARSKTAKHTWKWYADTTGELYTRGKNTLDGAKEKAIWARYDNLRSEAKQLYPKQYKKRFGNY